MIDMDEVGQKDPFLGFTILWLYDNHCMVKQETSNLLDTYLPLEFI